MEINRTARILNICGGGVVALVFLAGCQRVSSTSSGSSSPAPVPVISYPLELIITSQYENGGATTTEADCKIPAGSPAGTVLACTNSDGAATNTVGIPEARLYFSNLTFTVNVGSVSVLNDCEVMFFQPFYYMASTSGAFVPPWLGAGATPIDCSGGTQAPPSDCYGGVARDIVTNFPNFRGMYFLTAQSLSATYSAKSANSHTWGTNRWATNNLANRAASHVWKNGDSYVANTYTDYTVMCVDKYYQPVYGFTLTIDDEDITGVYPNAAQGNTSINQRPDWDATSWDY